MIIIIFVVAVLCIILISTRETQHKNILGKTLSPCSPGQKTTGYYRDGYCSTGPTDTGSHVVCARMDNNFLKFTKSRGNNLSTPRSGFPGLKSGQKWCLCAHRWAEAYKANKAPPIILDATDRSAIKFNRLQTYKKYAARRKTRRR
jgi:uncharacterized protein (DUF2237 family)